MDKKYRLRKNQDFKRVYSEGKSFYNKYLVMYLRKNELGYSRVGYTITKKIGKSVKRNKIKRRMKEIMRENFHNIDGDYDIILIPKKNSVNIDYKTLKSAVIHILKLSGILKR